MQFITDIRLGGKPADVRSWDDAEQAIMALKTQPRMTFFMGGSNHQMTIEYVEDKGYYVSAFGEGEFEEWLACDNKRTDKLVTVDISGHSDEIPMRVLVSDDIALEAAREFYYTGNRTAGCQWKKSIELM